MWNKIKSAMKWIGGAAAAVGVGIVGFTGGLPFVGTVAGAGILVGAFKVCVILSSAAVAGGLVTAAMSSLEGLAGSAAGALVLGGMYCWSALFIGLVIGAPWVYAAFWGAVTCWTILFVAGIIIGVVALVQSRN